MERRKWLKTLCAGSIAGAGCLGTTDATPPVLHGAYPGERAAQPGTFRPFERWIGRRPSILTLYVNADLSEESLQHYVETELTTVWETGHVPVLTWLPYLGSPEQTPKDIERRIHNGGYDQIVDRWISALTDWLIRDRESDRRIYFRPLPEMNGNWLPWSSAGAETTPRDYILAWRRLHDRFHNTDLTATHVQWLWNPNVREVGGVSTESYYPGDAYVDWVGIDGYNFGSTESWSEWIAPEELFDPMLSTLREITDKPVALPEFGSTSFKNGTPNPAAKSEWITAVYEFIAEQELKMACWFNVDKETDWAVFGGQRGTDVYEGENRRYQVYESYRQAVTNTPAMNEGQPARLLTDDQFAGQF